MAFQSSSSRHLSTETIMAAIVLLISTYVIPSSAFAPIARCTHSLPTPSSHLTSPLTSPVSNVSKKRAKLLPLLSSPNSNENNLSGVIDLTDDEEDAPSTSSNTQSTPNTPNTQQANTPAPFLSQGELSDDPNLLNPNFNDPKQTRVIIYIILTLVPILFLVPLMIGSRDLIPLDALPPVEM